MFQIALDSDECFCARMNEFERNKKKLLSVKMRGKIKSKHKKDFKMCKKISFFKSFELFSGASFIKNTI